MRIAGVPRPDLYPGPDLVPGYNAPPTLRNVNITAAYPVQTAQAPVAQSTSWTHVRFSFTLQTWPSATSNATPEIAMLLLVCLGRAGGGSVDWDDVSIRAV